MSVQRWDIERGAPAWVASKGEFVKHADHARIVAEKDDALAAALAEAVSVIEGLADQQAMYDGWYVEPLERLRAAAAAAPRTLTADDARAAVARMRAAARQPAYDLGLEAALVAIDALIHDGEATP